MTRIRGDAPRPHAVGSDLDVRAARVVSFPMATDERARMLLSFLLTGVCSPRWFPRHAARQVVMPCHAPFSLVVSRHLSCHKSQTTREALAVTRAA